MINYILYIMHRKDDDVDHVDDHVDHVDDDVDHVDDDIDHVVDHVDDDVVGDDVDDDADRVDDDVDGDDNDDIDGGIRSTEIVRPKFYIAMHLVTITGCILHRRG